MTSTTPRQKEEVPSARAGAFQITTDESWEEPDVVTGIFLVNSHPTRVLFDAGATNFFVSYKDCVLELDEHKFHVDLVPMDIRSFDVVIRMDWLA